MDDAQRQAPQGLAGLTALFRRYWLLIAVWTVMGTALAVWGITQLTPRYRAEAVLLLSTRVEHLSDLQSVVSGPLPAIPDPAVARGEVEVLRGRTLVERVIEQLGLQSSPDLAAHPSVIQHALDLLGLRRVAASLAPAPPMAVAAPQQQMNVAVDAYLRRFGAFNDGRSYSLVISYESSDPALAARVVNAHADLYLADQRALKERAAERAAHWLQQEIARLRSELEREQQAIRDLRERSGLIASGGATALERQTTDLGTQLAQVRADVAMRQARLIAARSGSSDAQPGVLDSELIHKLREQEAHAQQRVAGLSEQYGNGQPDLAAARSEAADVGAKIAQETARIVRGLQADLATAQQRETDLTTTLAGLQLQRDQQARAAAQGEDLERDAQGTRSVYERLLARLGEIEAQIGAADSDARLISPAAPPLRPASPNVPLLASVALILSATSGAGIAWLLDRRRTGVARADSLAQLGLVAFEPIPAVSRRGRRGRSLPDLLLAEPKSALADSVRALRGDVALSQNGEAPRVLAVTSALPGEGKTTTALLLGRSMAASGLQVLLVECDLRRPTVARQLGLAGTEQGLVAALRGDRAGLVGTAMEDSRSSMRVLTAEERVARPQDLLGGEGLQRLLAEARKHYDCVLVDTPPLGAVSDATLVARHADAILLVVRWQCTSAEVVEAAVAKLARCRLRVAGVVPNAVDLRRAARASRELTVMYRASRAYARKSYAD